MEYLSGQLGSAVLAVSPSSFLCIPIPLTGRAAREEEKSLTLGKQQLKHQCVIHIILIPNPKHNSLLATRNKNNSIPIGDKTLGFSVTLEAKMQ